MRSKKEEYAAAHTAAHTKHQHSWDGPRIVLSENASIATCSICGESAAPELIEGVGTIYAKVQRYMTLLALVTRCRALFVTQQQVGAWETGGIIHDIDATLLSLGLKTNSQLPATEGQ